LIEILPPLYIIDALVDYYFEYCNWVYRHVNQLTFLPAWQKFKSGGSPDRIILATAAVIVALTIRYLPPGHELLASLPGPFTHESYYNDLSAQYYEVMKNALKRYQDETKVYNLDLVELQLLRAHYLTFAKTDPEEIWSVRGELVTMGTAMGLHRDPGRSRFSRDTAERRRWAWWHIILLERSFIFSLSV
jgi:Fungal specific transcription factor domain